MDHLYPAVKEIALQENSSRLTYVRQFKWIGYDTANQYLKSFTNLLTYPKQHRMPNYLLVGDTNNGKTAILRRFIKLNPSYIDADSGKLVVPVLFIEGPDGPDEKKLLNSILIALQAPVKLSERTNLMEERVIQLLSNCSVRVLIIDEIHSMLAGPIQRQRKFLNLIKYLSNKLQISIILAGTKSAYNAIGTDPQIQNRFPPKTLKRWTNIKEVKRLLKSFELATPLKEPSYLYENSFAEKIKLMSDGLLGEIDKIIELSFELALEIGKEKITPKILDDIDYVPPSDRRKIA